MDEELQKQKEQGVDEGWRYRISHEVGLKGVDRKRKCLSEVDTNIVMTRVCLIFLFMNQG